MSWVKRGSSLLVRVTGLLRSAWMSERGGRYFSQACFAAGGVGAAVVLVKDTVMSPILVDWLSPASESQYVGVLLREGMEDMLLDEIERGEVLPSPDDKFAFHNLFDQSGKLRPIASPSHMDVKIYGNIQTLWDSSVAIPLYWILTTPTLLLERWPELISGIRKDWFWPKAPFPGLCLQAPSLAPAAISPPEMDTKPEQAVATEKSNSKVESKKSTVSYLNPYNWFSTSSSNKPASGANSDNSAAEGSRILTPSDQLAMLILSLSERAKRFAIQEQLQAQLTVNSTTAHTLTFLGSSLFLGGMGYLMHNNYRKRWQRSIPASSFNVAVFPTLTFVTVAMYVGLRRLVDVYREKVAVTVPAEISDELLEGGIEYYKHVIAMNKLLRRFMDMPEFQQPLPDAGYLDRFRTPTSGRSLLTKDGEIVANWWQNLTWFRTSYYTNQEKLRLLLSIKEQKETKRKETEIRLQTEHSKL